MLLGAWPESQSEASKTLSNSWLPRVSLDPRQLYNQHRSEERQVLRQSAKLGIGSGMCICCQGPLAIFTNDLEVHDSVLAFTPLQRALCYQCMRSGSSWPRQDWNVVMGNVASFWKLCSRIWASHPRRSSLLFPAVVPVTTKEDRGGPPDQIGFLRLVNTGCSGDISVLISVHFRI